MKYAVIQTGGKQYLVQEGQEIVVDRVDQKEAEAVELTMLARFVDEGALELGEPMLAHKAKATVVAHMKGDKIRVAKFKAKVRYRKVRGFRPALTKLKITQI